MIQDNTKIPGSEPLTDMFWDYMREQDADWCDQLETRIEYLETMNRELVVALKWYSTHDTSTDSLWLQSGLWRRAQYILKKYGVGDE